jgi:hypothetical protein
MVPQAQNGEKELPSRVEAIRLCNCAHATLSQQWGAAFDSLTHERVCDDTVRRSVCRWVRIKVFLGGYRNIFASPGNCTFRPILHWYTTCTAKRIETPRR